MTRSDWTRQLTPFLRPASDPEIAAQGVMEPKPDVVISFLLPYLSINADAGAYLNLSDDACLRILGVHSGEIVLSSISWTNIGSLSIELQSPRQDEAETQARKFILGE